MQPNHLVGFGIGGDCALKVHVVSLGNIGGVQIRTERQADHGGV